MSQQISWIKKSVKLLIFAKTELFRQIPAKLASKSSQDWKTLHLPQMLSSIYFFAYGLRVVEGFLDLLLSCVSQQILGIQEKVSQIVISVKMALPTKFQQNLESKHDMTR